MQGIPEPPNPDANLDNLETIPGERVAELSQASVPVEPPELTPYAISFKAYLPKLCQIDGMGLDCSAAVLKTIRDVGINFLGKGDGSSISSRISSIYVRREGDYMPLYSSLGEDEEIFEMKYEHHSKGIRFWIFYFSGLSERTFYIRAIRHTHLDTSNSPSIRRRA